jgi:hypothetical protein
LLEISIGREPKFLTVSFNDKFADGSGFYDDEGFGIILGDGDDR